MARVVSPPPPPSEPIDVNLRDALEERYLAYALSTIMGRALPDARDGLKPVHRRILYGMHVLKLDPGTAFKKCAKIVGDVMGSFHPHGDQAIYEALVRLAQDFASRYPLVEGQGNFGNIDGDNAAAYRYTEARLTDFARLLLEGIDEDAVDWRDNYSGDTQEPVVLPAATPNLLANGAQGIAVGMATSVPPHNVAELLDASLYLIAHPEASVDALLNFVPGPDFPTGGVLVDDRATIAEVYRTGRGGFRLRARWKKEEAGRGGWTAVVTEIPYGVQKSRLIEALAELVNQKKAPLLADVRDESTEDVRIVLEPRSRTVAPEVLMEQLFKLSELETRISVNMNVLVDGITPRVVALNEALQQWLEHRREVLLRRSRHRLAAIERRLELLAGMMIVYLNLDEVIRIVREEDEPKPALIARFALSDTQANYILDTRLRSLRRLEEMQLRKEETELAAEKGQIEALARLRGQAMEGDRARDSRHQEEIRAGDQNRQAPHDVRGAARRAGRSRRIPHRARADHGAAVAQRLDPRDERPCRRRIRRHLQGRRQSANVVLRRDDVENSGAGERRQGVHDRRRETARRPLTWRAAAIDGRHRRGGVDRRRMALRGGRKDARRGERRARLRRGRRTISSPPRARAARCWASRRRRSRVWPRPRAAIMSPSSARTASCWSFRSARSPRWRAARGCACNATGMAVSRTRAFSRSRTAWAGAIPRAAALMLGCRS